MNDTARNIILAGNTFAGLPPLGLDRFLLAQACSIDVSPPAPDYANPGGTGDRTALITVTSSSFPDAANGQAARSILVNGDKSTTNYWWQGTSTAGGYLQFDFGTPKVITEAKFYEQNNQHHTAKWQGWDGSTATDIGSSFQVGAARVLVSGGLYCETQTSLSGNTAGYRFYRLTTVSGSVSASPYIFEFEFKIDDA